MNMFKKSLAIGAAAIAVAFAGGAAQATDFAIPLVSSSGVYHGHFGDDVSGTFHDTFTFNLPTAGGTSIFSLSSASVSTSSFIKGFSLYLDSNIPDNRFTVIPGSPYFQFGGLSEVSLTSGLHTIFATGTTSGASFSGDIAIAAVPETATWAMMIAGVGFIGGAMRRRAIRTSVSFA